MNVAKDYENHWEIEDVEYDENSVQSEEEDDEPDSDAAESSKDSDNVEICSHVNEELLKEIELILKGSSEVNCTNALALNKVMQEKLVLVREKLQQLLESVKRRYVSNELKLLQTLKNKPRGIGARGAYLRGRTFYFRGNMFFKDSNFRNCPNNPDYKYRSGVENEIFPMDFELRSRHVWSIKDKVGIVNGVKEQILEHLNMFKANDLNSKKKKQSQVAFHKQNLAKLWQTVGDDFEIDWNRVSTIDVKYRHSEYSCNAMWNVYLKPSLKRSAWTSGENSRLLHAARRHNYQDWNSIAKDVGNRSNYQCFIHFYNTNEFLQADQKIMKWNKSDDHKLLSLIKTYTLNGVINWNAVCSRMPHRTKTNITTRYLYTLDPKISREPFTPEEDLMLLAAIEEYGENIASIPRTLFPNRTCMQLRGRYRNTLMNRKRIVDWSPEENQKLMDFVAKHGESSWSKCAEMLGHHSRISCRTRYLSIKKFLEKNPNATVKDMRSKKRKLGNDITTDNWVEKIAELGKNPTPTNSIQLNSSKNESKNKKKRLLSNMKDTVAKVNEQEIKLTWRPKHEITTELTPPTKSKRKPAKKLKDRLRSIDLEMYNFFKYSYNFQLGTDTCTKPLTRPHSLLLMKNACNFQVPKENPFIKDRTLPHTISESVERLILSSESTKINLTGYRLPPSWSTLMGFRALCVQSAQSITALPSTNDVDLDQIKAVHTFRQRLRVLFYKTGLISRLSPRLIINIDTRLKTQLMTLSELFLQSSQSSNAAILDRGSECTNAVILQTEEIKTKTEEQPSTKPPKKVIRKRKKSTPSISEPCTKTAKFEETQKITKVISQLKIELDME